jgi:hypothetical protein
MTHGVSAFEDAHVFGSGFQARHCLAENTSSRQVLHSAVTFAAVRKLTAPEQASGSEPSAIVAAVQPADGTPRSPVPAASPWIFFHA